METFKTDHAVIEYHSDNGIIQLTWTGFTPTKEYQEVLEKALSLIAKHQITRWLFDQGEAEVVSPHDQRWVVEDWTPRVIRELANKKVYSAVILPRNIFGELGIKNLVDTTRNIVITHFFTDVDTAKSWLLQQV